MRPAGNDNKGAMKLRVDFKKKHTGDFPLSMFTWRRTLFKSEPVYYKANEMKRKAGSC